MHVLHESPLLVLFLVAAVGYLAGKIEVAGFSLGVAAVLFAGLALGALDPSLALPEIVQSFGLVLFVYGIGVASGPGFFASLRRRGLRDNAAVVAVLGSGAALAGLLGHVLGLPGGTVAGTFAGALTNTPALASVMDAMKHAGAPAKGAAVAYSVTYPMGVIGVIVALWTARRVCREHERPSRTDTQLDSAGLIENITVRITRPQPSIDAARAALRGAGLNVLMGRMKRDGETRLAVGGAALDAGDLVTLVGTGDALRGATAILGELSEERLDLDRRVLDFRRMFVSNPTVTEKPLVSLRLPERFGAIVTRLRRGDVELLPEADSILELGDRVRVLAPRERMPEVARFFGDSYKALSEIDVITFGVGVALGLLLGAVPFPLPGGTSFRLGLAGGPLVVGLVLGRLGRTGRLVWTLPFSANLTLRQLGLVLFLAGVGTRSGEAFVTTLRNGGTAIFVAGTIVTSAVATTMIVVGHKLLRVPIPVLLGIVAGVQTQPAALAFASQQTGADQPNVGYASVYPVATIAKIVLAQVLLSVLR